MKPYPYNIYQKAWLRDLKTTRAKQGVGYLHSNLGWCCLGRACKILCIMQTNLKNYNNISDKPVDYNNKLPGVKVVYVYAYNGQTTVLPELVIKKLKLLSSKGDGKKLIRFEDKFYQDLAELSDQGISFKQIANIVESDPWNFFYE